MGFNGGFNQAENRMASRIDAHAKVFETNPVIRAAHEKTMRLFAGDATRPLSFDDVYDKASIERDLAKVKEIKGRHFEVGSDKIAADILEGIIYEQIELSNWFGPYAHTSKTCEFDDIVHGVDLVVELDEPEKPSTHLALGVDATYGTSTIQKKLSRIKRDIDSDRLAEIKYFESNDGRVKKRLRQVPRIVLGVEKDQVLALARLWTEGKSKVLGEHPIQELLIVQARKQLLVFKNYAVKRRRREAVRAYTDALDAFNAMIQAKKSKNMETPLMPDKVHAEILSGLDLFR